MKPALQIYSSDFDADCFRLPKDIQKRIEQTIDRLGVKSGYPSPPRHTGR